jgi:hypothetical protein
MKTQKPSAPHEETGRLYPGLDEGNHYRLQKISEIQQQLEKEIDVRRALYKKYRRGINAVDGVDTALVAASLGMGAAGVALLTTIVAAPIVLGLEIAAVACGLAGMAGKFVGRRLLVKAQKHDEVRVLAEAKLNTISSHISQALRDDQISDEEYQLILDEMDKYGHLKAEIRAQAHKAHAAVIDETTKTKLIQQGREEAKASMIKKLGGNSQ